MCAMCWWKLSVEKVSAGVRTCDMCCYVWVHFVVRITLHAPNDDWRCTQRWETGMFVMVLTQLILFFDETACWGCCCVCIVKDFVGSTWIPLIEVRCFQLRSGCWWVLSLSCARDVVVSCCSVRFCLNCCIICLICNGIFGVWDVVCERSFNEIFEDL